MLVLHNYFRSSTSTRLRVALNLKNLEYRYLSYSLLENEHRSPTFLGKAPSGLVPALELEDGTVLSQSLPIIEFLDEVHPHPPLLPENPEDRARVRALACMIACEIHPLNNLRVLRYLDDLGLDGFGKSEWFGHWVKTTFEPLERILMESPETGRFCHGDSPGLADICLYSQVWNNRRFHIDHAAYPTIERIFGELDRIAAFRRGAPPEQPDAR